SLFFFSSRRRHTRFSRDWSSDVCSSDLTLLIHSQDPERPSEILFRNLEDPHTYESAELGWFALSQANDPKITRRMWDTLNERLRDRKSTRLNSSHVKISYAVFCLKKKNR